jgi:hypothetical protein
MQPQQPYNNPYDFIVNPEKPQRRPVLNLGGSSMAMRIALVVGLLVVVVIVIIVGSSLLTSSGSNVTNMTSVAQDQTELIRVATEATQDQSNDISQTTTRYFADNCMLAINSEQQRLLSFLSAHGVKLTTAELALKQNSHTDAALQAAAASSTYDTAFLTAMQGDMSTYVSDIKVAFAASSNPQEKALLQTDYKDASLLQQQLTSAINNVNVGT